MKISQLIILFLATCFVSFSQSLPDRIPFFKDGLWGFCDSTMKLTIPCKYLKVQPFNGNYAAVLDSFAYWGFINKAGEEVLPPKYEEVAGFVDNYCRVKSGDKYGFIDAKLRELVPPVIPQICEDMNQMLNESGIGVCGKLVFDTTGKTMELMEYEATGDFSEGLLWVEKNRRGGFIDRAGKIVIPIKDFEEGETKPFFSEGLCGVRKKGSWGYIDKEGKEIIPFDDKYDNGYPFKKGFAAVSKKWKWGFIDKTGKEIVPLQYDFIQPFKEGMAIAVKNDKYGYVDETGKNVIPCQFQRGTDFRNGCAIINHLATRYLIDKKGKKISKDYEAIYFVNKGNFYMTENKSKRFGVVSNTGKELLPTKYKDVTWFDYQSEIGIVMTENTKYGLVNTKGKFIIPAEYDYLEYRGNGLIYAELYNLDGKGTEIKNVYVNDKLQSRAWLQRGFFNINGKKFFE